MNDKHIQQCPACYKDSAVRLVSAAAFHLKGTGWYATDFKQKQEPSKTAATPAAAADTKTDTATPVTAPVSTPAAVDTKKTDNSAK